MPLLKVTVLMSYLLTNFLWIHFSQSIHSELPSLQFGEGLHIDNWKLPQRVLETPQSFLHRLTQVQQSGCHNWPSFTKGHLKQSTHDSSSILQRNTFWPIFSQLYGVIVVVSANYWVSFFLAIVPCSKHTWATYAESETSEKLSTISLET